MYNNSLISPFPPLLIIPLTAFLLTLGNGFHPLLNLPHNLIWLPILNYLINDILLFPTYPFHIPFILPLRLRTIYLPFTNQPFIPLRFYPLFFHTVAPRLHLALGRMLQPDGIKEEMDVYFHCSVKANPKVYKISWYHNVSYLFVWI